MDIPKWSLRYRRTKDSFSKRRACVLQPRQFARENPTRQTSSHFRSKDEKGFSKLPTTFIYLTIMVHLALYVIKFPFLLPVMGYCLYKQRRLYYLLFTGGCYRASRCICFALIRTLHISNILGYNV